MIDENDQTDAVNGDEEVENVNESSAEKIKKKKKAESVWQIQFERQLKLNPVAEMKRLGSRQFMDNLKEVFQNDESADDATDDSIKLAYLLPQDILVKPQTYWGETEPYEAWEFKYNPAFEYEYFQKVKSGLNL